MWPIAGTSSYADISSSAGVSETLNLITNLDPDTVESQTLGTTTDRDRRRLTDRRAAERPSRRAGRSPGSPFPGKIAIALGISRQSAHEK